MNEESEFYARRRVENLANAAAAEAEARAIEAEAERMRKFLPPDPMAERRRLERENAARFAAEVAAEAEANARAAAAFRAKPKEPEAQKPRAPWVTSWRTQ